MTRRTLSAEAIAATIRAIPERYDAPVPETRLYEHCLEVTWSADGRRVAVTVSRVNVLVSLCQRGQPTHTEALTIDYVGWIRRALDWLLRD
jgi:hypothetical protein